MWTTIITTKNKARSTNSPLPYLFDKYNVLPPYPKSSSLNDSVIRRIYNEFVDGLNENPWLPKYICILPDKDIIQAAKYYGFSCKFVFHKAINYLATNMESELETRKEDLAGKHSGALRYDPILLWIKMIQRPCLKDTEKSYVFVQCPTFNSVLKSIVSKFKNMKVVNLYFPDDKNLFDSNGRLSSTGRTHFWRELNRYVQSIDAEGNQRRIEVEEEIKARHHVKAMAKAAAKKSSGQGGN